MHTGWEQPYRKDRAAYIRRFWSRCVRDNRPIAPQTRQEEVLSQLPKPISAVILFAQRKDFYTTQEWRELRYEALKKCGRKCQSCGRTPPYVILHVDHIKPKSLYPELCLTLENLQIMCEDCNLGKGASDQINWSEAPAQAAPRTNVIPFPAILPTDTRADRIRKIEAHRTPRGGFSRKSAQTLGIPWPLPKGWLRKLIDGS